MGVGRSSVPRGAREQELWELNPDASGEDPVTDPQACTQWGACQISKSFYDTG